VDLHSLAVPQVAGVAALILSDPGFYGYTHVAGSVASDIRSIIQKFSYPRLPDEPIVIWNGVDNYDCCGCLRRRDNSSSQCSKSSNSTAISTSTTTNTATVTTFTTTTTTVVEPPSRAKRAPRADANGIRGIAKRQTVSSTIIVTTITTTEAVTATASVCPVGYIQCGPNCANLQNDNNNCGSCGQTVSFLLVDSFTAYILHPNPR
jgi:hypothetical protein